jgi:hypothetical protein
VLDNVSIVEPSTPRRRRAAHAAFPDRIAVTTGSAWTLVALTLAALAIWACRWIVG